MRLCKIKRSSFHASDFACWDTVFINWNIEICIDMANHILACRRRIANSRQREETMACHVHHRFLVCCSLVINFQLIIIAQSKHNRHRQFARESFFVVCRNISQHERAVINLFCIPNASMETSRAAMQMVRTVIDCEVIFLSVERELAFANTIAIASNQG